VIIASVVVALALILLRIFSAAISLRAVVASSGVLILHVAPTLWSLTPLMNADSGLPFAGPQLATRPARGAGLPQNTRVIAYLNANRGGARFLVATPSANSAAPIILVTGEPVMALGGYSGSDPILTRDELAERVAANDVRLFLIPPQNNPPSELTQWIAANCARLPYFVPRGLQGAPSTPVAQNGTPQLYDCARR
jgi:4-amino-4-deoxy-L-arabinose transferase-like glycosyltransferase